MAKSENTTKPVSNSNATDINDKNIQNLTSSMAALTKQIEKNNAAMLVGSDTATDIRTETEIIEKSYDRQRDKLQSIASELKNALTSTLKISGTMASIGTIGFAANLVKDMVDLDNSMTRLSVRMGKGHAGIKGLKDSVHGLQKEFGTSYENAKSIVETLAKEKYVGNIKEAAGGIDLFSRASGLANGEVTEMTLSLQKMGGLSTKEINAMYASMTKVQQKVGISEKGMQALSSTIVDMTSNMAAFGKSSNDIKKMSASVTSLVGAMEQVGISAQKSTALVEQLTDPDRIEDNILLYSQLGISMEDAMTGNFDFDAMGPQFKEMAERVQAMGPIAGSAFAKSMGLSYKEVTKMANMEADSAQQIGEEAMTSEEKALGTLKELEAATEGIGTKIETGINKLEGSIKSLPPALLAAVAAAIPMIIKLGKKLIDGLFNRDEIQASVKDSALEGVEKASEGASAAVDRVAQKIPGAFGNSFKKVGDMAIGGVTKMGNYIAGSIGTWFDSTAVGGFLDGVETRIDAAFERANKKEFTVEWEMSGIENLSGTIDSQLEETSNYLDSLEERLLNLGVGINPDMLKDARGELGKLSIDPGKDTKGVNEKQRKAIKVAEKEFNKALRHEKALQNLKLRSLGFSEEITKQIEEQNNLAETAKKAKDDQLAAEEKVNNFVQERLKIQEDLKKVQEQMKELGDGKGNEALKSELQKQADELEKRRTKTDSDLSDARTVLDHTSKKNRKIYGKNLDFDSKISGAENRAEEIKNEASKAGKDNSGIKRLGRGLKYKVQEGMLNTRLGTSIMDKIGERDQQARVAGNKNGIGGFHKAGIAIGETAKAAGKGLARGGAKAGLAALKGIGKGIGGLLKSVGPMAIVMKVAGKLLERIQEPLEKMIDQIVEIFMPIVDAMMPAIEALVDSVVNVIATKLLPPALHVLAAILDVLHWILKPIVLILKALSHLPIIGDVFGGIGDALDAITSPETTKAMRTAADSLATSSFSMKDAAESLEDKGEEEEQKPEVINAEGGKFKSEGTTAMTTGMTADNKAAAMDVDSSSTDPREQMEKEASNNRDIANTDNMEQIKNNTNSLGIIKNLLETIIDIVRDGMNHTTSPEIDSIMNMS